MIRKFALIAPLMLAGLSACDRPAALTKAQPGECYEVVGRESNGAPKWQKTACAADQQVAAAEPAAAPVGADAAATSGALPPAASAPACPTQPVVCAPATGASSSNASVQRASRGKTVRRASRGKTSLERAIVEEREYARVPQEEPQPLLGGPDRYTFSQGDEYAYAPPPPPPMGRRFDRREYSYGYGERDRSYEVNPPAPLPPPPSADGYGRYEEHRYESGGRFAPPPRRGGKAHGGKAQGYAYGYSSRGYESRSYESERYSSSSHGGYAGPCCSNGYGNMAPMNGPHFPIDADGYLTWRGKTPGY